MLCAEQIKQRAAELGFAACGIARAEPVCDSTTRAFDAWIASGCHGGMGYMERYREQRMDPRHIEEGSEYRTVVSFALPYARSRSEEECCVPIAAYALGPDYHEVMRALLQQMGIPGRICVDTAPLMERYWAVQAGVGWIGRNHQLVLPGYGSAFFLGEILSADYADYYDTPIANGAAPGALCADCHKCEEACPTGALCPDGVFDARRCLSYQTIEHRGALEVDALWGIYGCDCCLKACPHYQRGAVEQTHFPMKPELASMQPDDWCRLTREQFNALFRHSAVRRTKYEGLIRNIKQIWRGNLNEL